MLPKYKQNIIFALFLFNAFALQAQQASEIQQESSVKQYKLEKRKALPMSEEGTRARNQVILDSIALGAELDLQGRFDSHLVQYMHSERKIEDAHHLFKAMEIAPSDIDMQGEALEYYAMVNDVAALNNIARQLDAAGVYSQHREYYAHMHALLGQSDLVFLNGESDTRPLLLEKSSNEKSYIVIRISWLSDPDYRGQLTKQGVKTPDTYANPSSFIQQVTNLNPSRSVLLSPTLNSDLLNNIMVPLYEDGLCLSLRPSASSSTESDYRQIRSALKELGGITSSQLGMNYLPLVSAARTQFLYKGKSAMVKETESIIERILKVNNKESLKDTLLD